MRAYVVLDVDGHVMDVYVGNGDENTPAEVDSMQSALERHGMRLYVRSVEPAASMKQAVEDTILEAKGAPETTEAVLAARQSMANTLRLAREKARITQAQLAGRLERNRGTKRGKLDLTSDVVLAETGRVDVTERYVAEVLRVCGLPPDWKPGKKNKPAREDGC